MGNKYDNYKYYVLNKYMVKDLIEHITKQKKKRVIPKITTKKGSLIRTDWILWK